jgi:MFS family permease
MPTYIIATVAYLGATLGCVFAHTAEVLVLFRALQGAGGKGPTVNAGTQQAGQEHCAGHDCAHCC